MTTKEMVDSVVLGAFCLVLMFCVTTMFQSCKQTEVQIALNANATKLVEKCYEITKDAEKCLNPTPGQEKKDK